MLRFFRRIKFTLVNNGGFNTYTYKEFKQTVVILKKIYKIVALLSENTIDFEESFALCYNVRKHVDNLDALSELIQQYLYTVKKIPEKEMYIREFFNSLTFPFNNGSGKEFYREQQMGFLYLVGDRFNFLNWVYKTF